MATTERRGARWRRWAGDAVTQALAVGIALALFWLVGRFTGKGFAWAVGAWGVVVIVGVIAIRALDLAEPLDAED